MIVDVMCHSDYIIHRLYSPSIRQWSIDYRSQHLYLVEQDFEEGYMVFKIFDIENWDWIHK